MSYRFCVAFSFAGPHREKVRAIAELVAAKLGKNRVFYDDWYEAEILGPQMRALLQRFYFEQSQMVVADLSDEYAGRPWCQAEAEAIDALRMEIDPARDETGRLRLLNIKFGDGKVPGVFPSTGYLDATRRTERECADLILERHALLMLRLNQKTQMPLISVNTDEAPNSPFEAPRAPEPFVGRAADLLNVVKILQSGNTASIRSGLGGMGKTALASKVSQELRYHFRDGVLWIRLDEQNVESVPLRLLSSLGDEVAAKARTLATDDARLRYLRSVLPRKSVLVVFDNVQSIDQVREMLTCSGKCVFLITSRIAFGPDTGIKEYHLHPLTPEGAQSLLDLLLPKEIQSRGMLDDLLLELGGVPLAIHIVAGILIDSGWTPTELLTRLRTEKGLEWLSVPDGDSCLRNSFSLSYKNLPSDDLRQAFRALGVLSSRVVNPKILSAVMSKAHAWSEMVLLGLVRRGLVDRGSTTTPMDYVIHPLMYRFAREVAWTIPAEAQKMLLQLGEHYRTESGAWEHERGFIHGTVETQCNSIAAISSIQCLLEAHLYCEADSWLVGLADLISRDGHIKTLVSMLETIKQYRTLSPWLRLYYADFVLLGHCQGSLHEARDNLQHLTSDDDPKIASAALICLGRHSFKHHQISQAERFFRQSLKIKSAMVPRDAKGISYILGEIAHLRVNQGARIEVALRLHFRALKIQETTSDIKGQAYSFRRIASIYLRFLNNPERALVELNKSQSCAERGALKFLQVTIAIERAEALRQLDFYTRALSELERGLKIALDCQDVAAEAHVLKRLGSLYEKAEHFGKAKEAYDRCLQLCRIVEPDEVNDLQRTVERVQLIIQKLLGELEVAQGELNCVNQKMEPQKARCLRKQIKRIRQRLNLEPALIRIGR